MLVQLAAQMTTEVLFLKAVIVPQMVLDSEMIAPKGKDLQR